MMPKRIQLSRRKGYRKPEGAVVVSRPSIFGNPFVFTPAPNGGRYRPGGREQENAKRKKECIDLYRYHLLNDEREQWARMRAALPELRGKDLACWCPLPANGKTDLCHAAVLLVEANREEPRDIGIRRLSDLACPVCRDLAVDGKIRPETVQRMPSGAFAKMSRYTRRLKICDDCAAAEMMFGAGLVPTFEHARIAVANDRQEQYRLPGVRMGLVLAGYTQPSKPGDLDDQIAWLDRNGWFGCDRGAL